jgi:uncharacterized phage infection (PIP) family protein YhgE
MSTPPPAPSPWRFALSRHTWLTPVIFILGLAVLLPAIYLSATVNPQGHLKGLPIALVVEKQTGTNDHAASEAVASAISSGVNDEKIQLVRLSSAELASRMKDDSIAGAIVIPANFDASIASLTPTRPGEPSPTVTVPVVEIRTNAGDGGISNGLVTGNLAPVLDGVQQGFGAKLVAAVEATGAPLTDVQRYLLANPFTVQSSAYTPLPANAGLGTSAFYYTLALVLLGFIGASVINPFVDSAMGFAPSELGPLVARRPYLKFTRRQTLLAKFLVMICVSPVAAATTLLVAGPLVGVPVGNPWMLWLFSTVSIAAVGVSALTVFAIFGGGIGSLVNTLFFIVLSMTSSGGTVPLAATPSFFQWLATFEPYHAIVEGVRAILYFDANPAAGLTDAWIRVTIGLAIGLGLGILVTTLYARKRMFTRHPRPAPPITTPD